MASKYFKSIINPDGSKADVSKLDGKIVGIYFSAHWCPPCKQFTPVLASCYSALLKEGKPFEIVFCSSDKSQGEFDSYFRTHPWKAVPYSDQQTIRTLGSNFKVSGIPSLIFIDPKGEVITDQGRQIISTQGGKAWPFGSKIDPMANIEKKKQKAEDSKILVQKQAELGAEPSENAVGVMQIQINTPSGLKTRRRFLETDTISDVMRFCRAWDLTLNNQDFVVRTNYPKKQVFTDATITLKAAGFQKQENLFFQIGTKAVGEAHRAPRTAATASTTATARTTTSTTIPNAAGAPQPAQGGWFGGWFGGGSSAPTNAPPPAAAAGASGPVSCSACTYANPAGSDRCQMCQTKL
eukprot:gb/GEZN01010342.1/.p1 GENE.gb/GEZN01010342.1/~~gb/GEZN01010342.1/.p1  ORF type:complete len:352 (+),score=50.21 gb/GEZN01010342.1/:23-1078(+)